MTVEPRDRAEVRIEQGADPAATERILQALPEWFGLEQSLLDHVEAAKRLPSHLAPRGDDVVGVLLVEPHVPPLRRSTGWPSPRLFTGPASVGAWSRRPRPSSRPTACGCSRSRPSIRPTVRPSDPDPSYRGTRGFYEAMGFAPLEELPDLWPGNPCLILVKTLGPA